MDIPETIRSACEAVRAMRLPRWEELPDIELYMDQVIALMGKYLQGVTAGDEKLLTPSMVNNYVKLGLMPAPVKKKYSRSHLAHLIIICAMKRVMPMSAIGELIQAGLSALSEEELLRLVADYYEHAAAQAVERTLERVRAIAFEGETGVRLLAASCAIRSQLELCLAEKLAAGSPES